MKTEAPLRNPHPGEATLTRTLIRQARDLNVSIRNKFRNEPAVLAEWSTDSRIHRTGAAPTTTPRYPNPLPPNK